MAEAATAEREGGSGQGMPGWSHGTVYWSELNTRDPERAKRFYADAIGWNFDPVPMDEGAYWAIKAGETLVGGMFEMKGPAFEGVPEHWLSYIAVDDVEARVAKATAGGVTVIRPPFNVEGVGRIAILREPGGAVVGWMTPAS